MVQSGKCAEFRPQTFMRVIEAIYDCSLDPYRWQKALCMIAESCRSHYGSLRISDLENGRDELTFYVGDDQRYERLHKDHSSITDPYPGSLQSLPVGTVATRAMLIDNNEFLESEFYHDFLKPQGIHDTIGFNVLKTAQRIGQLTTHRIESEGRYEDADVRLLDLLAPHVCRPEKI